LLLKSLAAESREIKKDSETKHMDRFNPWIRKGEKLGSAQAGTFIGSRIGANGISEKVISDDATSNAPLVPPPDMDNVVLAGGVNVEVQMDTDYSPKVMNDGRMRTCELVIRTLVSSLQNGSYGIGAKRPNSSPSNNKGESQTITKDDVKKFEDVLPKAQ
jgi:hypothetical protein